MKPRILSGTSIRFVANRTQASITQRLKDSKVRRSIAVACRAGFVLKNYSNTVRRLDEL